MTIFPILHLPKDSFTSTNTKLSCESIIKEKQTVIKIQVSSAADALSLKQYFNFTLGSYNNMNWSFPQKKINISKSVL